MNSIKFTEKYAKKKVADFETLYIFEVEITRKWKKKKKKFKKCILLIRH